MSALLTTLLIAMFLPYLAKIPLMKAMNERGGLRQPSSAPTTSRP